MATFRASSYGANINLGVNVNADHGWGGYQYPGGVPANLLGTASYGGVTSRVRKELAVLYSLAYQIAREVHGYVIYSTNPNGSGEAWGPWGYENRTISGSSTPSNHSRGKANDWNAPYNGYANGFSNIVSDFPPGMVADIESIGFGWGGRYGDAMHWEYAYSPADVPGHEAKARQILGGKAIGTAPSKPAEDDSMSAQDVAELKQYIDAKLTDLVTNIWIKGITGNGPGQHANELLAAAAVNAAVAATQVTVQTDEIDARLRDLPTAVWTKSITDQSSAQMLADLVAATQRIESDLVVPPKA